VSLPTLAIELVWTGRKGYHREPIPTGGEGQTVWNPAATVRLKEDGKVLFEKVYPAAAWQTSYATRGKIDLPASLHILRIQTDIRRGVYFDKVVALAPRDTKATSISGTKWKVKTERTEFECEFRDKGVFKHNLGGKLQDGDGWLQDGDVVRFSRNDGFIEYEGRIESEERLAGTARSDTQTFSWSALRIQR
jgi:hypothetical protein